MPRERVIRTDEGFLRAPARLTRAGVFTYRNGGREWRELRLPEEVFATDSLRSFELLPLVYDHPRENAGAVDSNNARRLTVGSVGHVTRDSGDSNYVAAEVLITDADAVRAVENGDRELSCGYFCEREPAPPGSTFKDPVTGDALPYDFIQRNIRGNHVAIVKAGRAGPDAKIMLDHNDGIESNPTGDPVDQKGDTTMKKKITIDGLSFEVDENVAQAFEKLTAAQNATIDKLTARADAADSQVKDLTAKLTEATNPKRFAEAVSSRLALVQIAEKNAIKADGLDDMAIRRAVITKIDPSLKLDGRSDDYVIAAFDLVSARNPVVTQLDSLTPTRPAAKPGEHRSQYVDGFYKFDPTKRS